MTEFGPVETVEVRDLAVDDFVVAVPTQKGVRGVTVNSGIRELRADYGSWTQSGGYRRRRLPVESRLLLFKDHATWRQGGLNYPLDFIVEVRRSR